MTDEQIKTMLEEIIEYVDYDLYKSYFVPECWECSPEEAKKEINALVAIARKHMKE